MAARSRPDAFEPEGRFGEVRDAGRAVESRDLAIVHAVYFHLSLVVDFYLSLLSISI
jgi:hypothetical protein